MISKEQVIEKLKTVIDPEIDLDIYTMGLIYDIKISSDIEVHILLTYTTPMCPFGPMLNKKITEVLQDLGFKTIDIELTFDPPWEPSEELRKSLGL